MLGKTKGKRRRGQQRMIWLDSITDSMDMNQRKLREMVKDRRGRCAAVHGVIKSRTQLGDSTTTTIHKDAIIFLHKTTFISIHDKWLLLSNLWGLSTSTLVEECLIKQAGGDINCVIKECEYHENTVLLK